MEDTFTKLEELLKQLSTGKGKEQAILQAARKGLLEEISDENKKRQYYEKAVDFLESDKREEPAADLAYRGKLYERAVSLYERIILQSLTEQRQGAERRIPQQRQHGMKPENDAHFLATFGLERLMKTVATAITISREGGMARKVQEFYDIGRNLYEAVPYVKESYKWNLELARLANAAGMVEETNKLYNLAFDNMIASINSKYAIPYVQWEIVVEIGREGKLWDKLIGYCLDEHKGPPDGRIQAARFSKEAGREIQARGLYDKIIINCEMNGGFGTAAEVSDEAGLEERAAFYRQLTNLLK